MPKIPYTLETSRLQLRQFEISDARSLHEELNHSYEHLEPWLLWLRPDMTLEEREEFCQRTYANYLEDKGAIYGLWIKESGRLAGVMNASDIDWKIPSAEVGYWGAVDTLGKGYISESVRAISQYLIRKLDFERVWLTCDANNIASQRVAERAGMTQEGRLRHARRNKQGELSDTLYYAVIKD